MEPFPFYRPSHVGPLACEIRGFLNEEAFHEEDKLSQLVCDYYAPARQESTCQLIGILASSIRGDWNDIDARMDKLFELCCEFGCKKWIKQLQSTREMYEDGRWFRDSWRGPYSGDHHLIDPCTILFDDYFAILGDVGSECEFGTDNYSIYFTKRLADDPDDISCRLLLDHLREKYGKTAESNK